MDKIESLKRKFEGNDQTGGETEMRKMLNISLLNIDTRPCVKTETQKHQKLIDQFGFQIFIQFILSSAGGILSLTLTDSILFLSLRP